MDDDPQAKIFFSLLSDSPISTIVKTEEWNSFFAFLRLNDLFKRMINEMAVSVCPIHIWSKYMDSYRKDYALRTKAASECKMDRLNLDTFPAEVIDRICAFLYPKSSLLPLMKVNRALRSTVTPAHRRFRLKHLTSSSRDKSALSHINRNPEDTRFTTHLTIKGVVKPSLTTTFSHHDLFPNLKALVFHVTSQEDHLFIEQLGCRHLKDLKLSQCISMPVKHAAQISQFLRRCPDLESLDVDRSSYLPVVTFPHLRKFSLSGSGTGFPNLFLEINESISCFSMDDKFRPRKDVLPNLTEANISVVTWDWLVAPMMTRGGLQRPLKRVTLSSKYHSLTYRNENIRYMSTLRHLVEIKNCPTTDDWVTNLPPSIQKIQFNKIDDGSVRLPPLPNLTEVCVEMPSDQHIDSDDILSQPIGSSSSDGKSKTFLWMARWMTEVPSIRRMCIEETGRGTTVDAHRSSNLVRVVISVYKEVACVLHLQQVRGDMILKERRNSYKSYVEFGMVDSPGLDDWERHAELENVQDFWLAEDEEEQMEELRWPEEGGGHQITAQVLFPLQDEQEIIARDDTDAQEQEDTEEKQEPEEDEEIPERSEKRQKTEEYVSPEDETRPEETLRGDEQ
ncbi:hypothetical protein PROFUN_16036 [Planoprotostelium fungivorum]|uniref:F-box domain-containing protein n=1 Tax=Planoprotostelium fungivorum TaxID=1890364 RepID=A0A2P6MTB6_9EUKA|nr:hypothetical protein PROFUN_16036 [Planoprotostelium fungivorum]